MPEGRSISDLRAWGGSNEDGEGNVKKFQTDIKRNHAPCAARRAARTPQEDGVSSGTTKGVNARDK